MWLALLFAIVLSSKDVLVKQEYSAGDYQFPAETVTVGSNRVAVIIPRDSITDTNAVFDMILEQSVDGIKWIFLCSTMGMTNGAKIPASGLTCQLGIGMKQVRGTFAVKSGKVDAKVVISK